MSKFIHQKISYFVLESQTSNRTSTSNFGSQYDCQEGMDEPDRIMKYEFDYYQVLKVTPKEANDTSLLTKKYRQLALLIHPDKCTHPLATDAFKGIC